MEQQLKKRFCGNCGKELKGRTDKRFCDDSCRNTFNHAARIPDNEVIAPITNILKKNRSVLLKAFEGEQRIFSKTQLADRGYKFDYCTDHRTLGGAEYYFCYDMGYEITSEAKYEILSAAYFEFIYRDFLRQLPNMPTGDPDVEEDVLYWSMLREPLHINSEYKEPPYSKPENTNNIYIIE